MKRVLVLLLLIFSMLSANATDASKFAEQQYSESNENKAVHITVKKEHTMEYQQPVGNVMVPAITYGFGDMKVKGCRKCRITYICLLDDNCKPFWSFIFPDTKR